METKHWEHAYTAVVIISRIQSEVKNRQRSNFSWLNRNAIKILTTSVPRASHSQQRFLCVVNTHRGLCSSEISLLPLSGDTDTGENEQIRWHEDHLWGDAILHPRLVPPGCRAALLCQDLTLLLHPISHTREERRQERWASTGSRWAPVSSHMSGDQCFGLCINKKEKKWKRKTPPSVGFLITWSSDATWKRNLAALFFFFLSEQG